MKTFLIVSCYNDSNTHETWFINDYIKADDMYKAIDRFKHSANGINTIINIIELH